MNPKLEKVLKLPLYQKILIVVLLSLGIVAAFGNFLIYPKYQEYTQLVADNQALDAKLAEERRIASNLPRFKAEYEKMTERFQKTLTELPNDKEIPNLLTQIATKAKENGLDVVRFKPGGEIPKGFYAEVPVELKLIGTFHEVARFFYDVGDLPRIVNISNASFAGAKAVDKRMDLTVDCLATTFRYLDQSQQPKGEEKK